MIDRHFGALHGSHCAQDGKQHGIGVFKTAKGDFRRGEWKVLKVKLVIPTKLESMLRRGTESAGYQRLWSGSVSREQSVRLSKSSVLCRHIERMVSSQEVPRRLGLVS